MNDRRIYDRFNKVYDEIFPLIDQKGNRQFNPESVTDENISILLSWPGILAIKIAEQTGSKKLSHEFERLKKQLNRGLFDTKDSSTVNDTFYLTLKKVMGKLFFLVHPKSIHLDIDIIKDLCFSVSQYLLLVCFLVRYKAKKEKSICLSIENIIEILNEASGGNSFQRAILFLGLNWLALSQGMVQRDIKRYFKIVETSFPTRTLVIGSGELVMHQLVTQTENQFCYIEHEKNNDKNSTSIGFGLNINYFDNIPFNVWMMEFNDDYASLSEQTQYYGYLFESEWIENDDITEDILKCIFITAQETKDVSETLGDVWDDFIENTDSHVSINIDQFELWIQHIIKSSDNLEVFKNFTPLFSAIGWLDLKLNNKKIIKIRKDVNKALKKHIPPDPNGLLKKQLNEAYEEIKQIVDIIRANESRLKYQSNDLVDKKGNLAPEDRTATDDESLIDFVNRKKHVYKYIKYAENDKFIPDSLWSHKPEYAYKGVARSVLPTILKKLTGINYNVPGTTILKFVGIPC